MHQQLIRPRTQKDSVSIYRIGLSKARAVAIKRDVLGIKNITAGTVFQHSTQKIK